VITGGDSGIGRAVALAFARKGADVLISHLEEEERERDAQETLCVVRDTGRTGMSMARDLRDEGYCRALIERAA
jgi:NAD(P)-dependent dehydrogenase (short-subunit alcohol dehydrogenase family)